MWAQESFPSVSMSFSLYWPILIQLIRELPMLRLVIGQWVEGQDEPRREYENRIFFPCGSSCVHDWRACFLFSKKKTRAQTWTGKVNYRPVESSSLLASELTFPDMPLIHFSFAFSFLLIGKLAKENISGMSHTSLSNGWTNLFPFCSKPLEGSVGRDESRGGGKE